MKYLVTESQIKNMMWNYLNSVDYTILEDDHFNEIFLLRNGSEDYHDYVYKFDDKHLLVETELVLTFAGLFDVTEEDALNYIGDWFEEKYGLEVEEIINWS
jgi:hypothetical protein